MNYEDWQREIARLMRETADLVEQGLVQVTQIDTEYGIGEFSGFDYVKRMYSTGHRTVILKMHGFDGSSMPDWMGAQRGPGNRALSAQRKLLSQEK